MAMASNDVFGSVAMRDNEMLRGIAPAALVAYHRRIGVMAMAASRVA